MPTNHPGAARLKQRLSENPDLLLHTRSVAEPLLLPLILDAVIRVTCRQMRGETPSVIAAIAQALVAQIGARCVASRTRPSQSAR